jgi:hypothetical protein
LPLGGRGPRLTPGAAILSSLVAQALLLEDQIGQRTLWLSYDLIGLSRAFAHNLRFALAAACNVPYTAVILCASHTHSGPLTVFEEYASHLSKPPALQAYEDDLWQRFSNVAAQAVARLQPVTITCHRGASEIGINRRQRTPEGETMMAPNPSGAYNPDLWILDIRGTANGERCLLFSVGCHPVIVYGFAWDGISAEYPGVCRHQLRQHLGGAVHGQFIQGLTGNVRPRILADLEQNRFRPATPADVETVGRQLAGEVLATLDKPGRRLELALSAAAGWVYAVRDLHKAPGLAHWQTLQAPTDRARFKQEDELNRNLSQYWSQRLAKGPPPTPATPWEVGLMRLAPGETIAWFADEAVVEWLGRLRNWLQDDQLIAWSYCQHCTGYLPTDELLPEGGYEVNSSNWYGKWGPGPFAPGLNEATRQTFQALARQLGLVGSGQ